MKKTFIALLLVASFVPFYADAISVGWDRYVAGGLRTLYSGDKVLIGATATSTTANLEVIGTAYVSGTTTSPCFSNNGSTCISSGGTPGGSDTQVQFNDGGSFGGDSSFTLNKTTDAVTLGDNSLTNYSLSRGLWAFASTTPVSVTGSERVIFEDATGANSDWLFRVAGGGWGVLNFATSRGTLGTPTVSTSGDDMGALYFFGYDGAGYENSAQIRAEVDATPGANDMPSALVFSTTPDGSNVVADRIEIDSSGNLKPFTSDGVALGTTANMWADLFLASGGVVNFNNGDVTLTHSAGALTMSADLLDLGGSSLEIPNGTAPTVDAVGEIGFDTTDNQLLVATGTTPAVLPTTQKLWSATVASSSVDFVSGGRIPIPMIRDGITITEISCFVDGGTSVVINIDSLAGGAQTDTLTCDADGATDSAQSQNTARSANSLNVVEFGTVTGAVDYVSFTVSGTYTRE